MAVEMGESEAAAGSAGVGPAAEVAGSEAPAAAG